VLKLGISPTRIVFAHPYKPVSSLLHAKYKDVSLMTVDCSEELFKVKEFYPSARYTDMLKFILFMGFI
jgi:ornithine decarboxylase